MKPYPVPLSSLLPPLPPRSCNREAKGSGWGFDSVASSYSTSSSLSASISSGSSMSSIDSGLGSPRSPPICRHQCGIEAAAVISGSSSFYSQGGAHATATRRPASRRKPRPPPSKMIISEFPGVTFNLPILTSSPPKVALSGTARRAVPANQASASPLNTRSIVGAGKGLAPHWLALVARQLVENTINMTNGPTHSSFPSSSADCPIAEAKNSAQKATNSNVKIVPPDQVARSRVSDEPDAILPSQSRSERISPASPPALPSNPPRLAALDDSLSPLSSSALSSTHSLPCSPTETTAACNISLSENVQLPTPSANVPIAAHSNQGVSLDIAASIAASILTPPLTPMLSRLRDIAGGATSVSSPPAEPAIAQPKQEPGPLLSDDSDLMDGLTSVPSSGVSSMSSTRETSPLDHIDTPPASPQMSSCSSFTELSRQPSHEEIDLTSSPPPCDGRKRGRRPGGSSNRTRPAAADGSGTQRSKKRRAIPASTPPADSVSAAAAAAAAAALGERKVQGGYLSTCYSCQNDYLSDKPVARAAPGRQSARRAAAITAAAYGHGADPRNLREAFQSVPNGEVPLCPVCADLFERHGLRCTACYFVPAENVVDDGQVKCERCFGGTYCGSRM